MEPDGVPKLREMRRCPECGRNAMKFEKRAGLGIKSARKAGGGRVLRRRFGPAWVCKKCGHTIPEKKTGW